MNFKFFVSTELVEPYNFLRDTHCVQQKIILVNIYDTRPTLEQKNLFRSFVMAMRTRPSFNNLNTVSNALGIVKTPRPN